ncbi:hypothetical protein WMY93_031350 [Mugilogobius chulae]|uniref:T-complex protein 1 subunit gamma n=1 Tax=Mugilogobius chulae TaxID=88201 RepID=A0AAW0MML3_9GOBI
MKREEIMKEDTERGGDTTTNVCVNPTGPDQSFSPGLSPGSGPAQVRAQSWFWSGSGLDRVGFRFPGKDSGWVQLQVQAQVDPVFRLPPVIGRGADTSSSPRLSVSVLVADWSAALPFPLEASTGSVSKMFGQQVLVLNQNVKRESGRKTIADVIRTCLGPRAMMKMLLDPTGGIVMTNDGNAILREIQVQHPAAKSMIEISRTQDEEVGDGTTSVIILAGEMLSVAEQFLEQQMHPTVIIGAYRKALDDMLDVLKEISMPVDTSDRSMMLKIIHSAINTKALSRWSELACSIALDAVKTVELEENGRKEIDIKKYAKVEKVPGGIIEDSCVLRGVMINKDVTHPRMKRNIKNPRIVLLDCSLEYKKGESQTDIEMSKEEDFARILQMEEEYIQQICEDIIRLKPDLLFTEKGISVLFCFRLGSTLSGESKHHSHPPSQARPTTTASPGTLRQHRRQDRQQPHRPATTHTTTHYTHNYTHTHKTDNNRIARYNYTLYYTQLHTTTHNYTLYYTQPHTTTHNHTQLHNACGARIVSRTDELREDDIGLGAGLFEVKKIGDEYFTFITECKDPKPAPSC